ncbi:MAG TPA: VWA domain-containing protein, partial [Bryobacterales bacterium]|nr:VWA domain-containing protein [Bryobacterales bacterium]
MKAPTKRGTGSELPPEASADREIDAFIEQVRAMPQKTAGGARGRLIFSMDATMSRQPTWDRAQHLQARMFEETARIGGLDVQLVFYRGFNECKASKWVSDAARLAALMSRVECRGGYTQIGRVLGHVLKEAGRSRVSAVVHVGD